jgi:hypothetical protein
MERKMKQDYTMYIYRTDRRYKTGERLYSTTVWTSRDAASMRRECNELYDLYPATKGWRFEYHPTMVTVKNLMTGKDVEIDRDTPWCCNPASETYWSM